MGDAKDSEETQIVFRCSSELEEQFMLAYREAAIEGHAPANGTRSEALRQLMRSMVNNPEIIKYGSTDEEMEELNDS